METFRSNFFNKKIQLFEVAETSTALGTDVSFNYLNTTFAYLRNVKIRRFDSEARTSLNRIVTKCTIRMRKFDIDLNKIMVVTSDNKAYRIDEKTLNYLDTQISFELVNVNDIQLQWHED
jgi:hypothetical protein